MPSEHLPAEGPAFVGSDDDVDVVIELCGGDAREAVRTLIIAYTAVEEELARLQHQVSRGYVRGREPR